MKLLNTIFTILALTLVGTIVASALNQVAATTSPGMPRMPGATPGVMGNGYRLGGSIGQPDVQAKAVVSLNAADNS